MPEPSSAGEAVGLGLADADAVDGQSGWEPTRALEVALGKWPEKLFGSGTGCTGCRLGPGQSKSSTAGTNTVAGAAARAGLRQSSYEAAAALASAQGLAPPTEDSQGESY